MMQFGFIYTSIESTMDDSMLRHKQTSKKIKFGSEKIGIGLKRERELAPIQLLREH